MAQKINTIVGIEDDKFKKTMQAPLEFLNSIVGKPFTADMLKKFAADFAVKSAGTTGESKPREITKLFNKAGDLLGGRCSATLLWFALPDFNHHHGLSKQAQNAKSRLNTKAKEVEVEAGKLLESARELTNPTEKLKAFEAYDVEMGKAQAIRNTKITPKDFSEEVTSYESIEDLAKALKVEVITSKPKAEKAETTDDAPEVAQPTAKV